MALHRMYSMWVKGISNCDAILISLDMFREEM